MDNLTEEVERSLRSLKGLQRAIPKPFFYSRLTARLKNRKELISKMEWQWSLAGAFFLVLVNLYVLSAKVDSADAGLTNEQAIEMLSEEYVVNAVDIYSNQLMEEDESY